VTALTLTELIAKTKQLRQVARLIPPDSFKERLYDTYRAYVLTQIQKVLAQASHPASVDAEDEQLKKLYPIRICLQTVWESFKGSSFCYTALHDDVAQLCCEIAEHLSEQYDTLLRKLGKRDTQAMQEGFHFAYSPLALLMPHVVLEHTHAAYAVPKDLWQQDLQMILRTHILDESGCTLLPVLMLAREPLIIPPGYYKLHLINPAYKSLIELDEIRKQREACLAEIDEPLTETDQQHARMIAERLAAQKQGQEEKRRQNLPLDQTENAAHELIQSAMKKSEINRMRKHSPKTEKVYIQWKDYYQLAHSEDHLLGQLNLLIKHLYVNSLHSDGTEEVAGPDAEKAVGRFQTYYEALSDEAKQKIPIAVKKAIEFLLDVTFNPAVNAVSKMHDLCASHQNIALRKAIAGHEETLASIGLTQDTQAALITASSNALEEARNQLRRALENLRYAGADPLSLSHKALQTLDQSFEVNSLKDALMLKYATPAEIKILLAGYDKAQLRKQWIQHIGKLGTLVCYLLELSDEQLNAFFQIMGKDLLNPHEDHTIHAAYLSSEQSLNGILHILTPTSLKAALKGLQASLDSSEDLNRLLQILPANYCRELNFHALTHFIKNLPKILPKLSTEKWSALYHALKAQNQLSEITIESVDDLAEMLTYSTPEQCGEICRMPNFSSMLNSADCRSKLFSGLNETKQSIAYEALGGAERAADFVNSAKDFIDVLPRKPASQQITALYEELKKRDKLSSLTVALLDHALKMLDQLTVDQCREVCGMPNFASSMKSAKKFSDTLKYLNTQRAREKGMAVYQSLGGALTIAEFTQSTTDLRDVLLVLTKEKRTAFFDTLRTQGKLATLTVDPDHGVLYKILERLDREQRQELCDILDLSVFQQNSLTQLNLKLVLNTFHIKIGLGRFPPRTPSPAQAGLFATGRNPTAQGDAARRRAAARRQTALGQATTPPPTRLSEAENPNPRGYFSA
jgi:hypothetical protein